MLNGQKGARRLGGRRVVRKWALVGAGWSEGAGWFQRDGRAEPLGVLEGAGWLGRRWVVRKALGG